ncbi:MAG: acyl-CoA dehydrogenase [Gammaproteobacteria bacterium]
MATWLVVGLVIFVPFTLAVIRASALVWSIALFTLLALSASTFSLWLIIPAAILITAFTLIFSIPSVRLRFFSQPVMTFFRSIMPEVSDTEREALEAGSTWWEADLFSGKPDWNKLLALPEPALTAEEQAFLEGPVEELCRMVNDWEITEELHDLPENVWDFIRNQGFFGMIIPKKYGGLEFSAYAHSCVVMKLSGRSITAAVTVMVPNSLGPAQLLLHYGTEKQKDYYLPRLARGQEIPCFALTGPEAGSDAASMPDTGIVCKQSYKGKETLGILLNWDKRYITLGPVATVLGLAFKLFDPEHILGDDEELGITVALIPTDTPGVEIGRRHFPLNQAFMNGPNSGHDVFIPMDWIIGGQARTGQGWRMLMESLADGRSISLPALSTGAAKLAARTCGAYSVTRKQFKTSIGQFEGVADALGRIAGFAYGMDAARGLTTLAVDRGEKPSVASAIVKYHLTERMRLVMNDAMDIHGGRGICMGPNNYLARGYEGVPISITVEGANILTRSLIIFGQGAIRCHPYLLKEMDSATAKDLPAFDEALSGHVKLAMSNFSRTFLHGITGAYFAKAPGNRIENRCYKQLTRLSAAFAITSETALLLLGGSLKRRESLSGRLGDVLSHLYLASASLKRFSDQGHRVEDQPLLEWSVQYEIYHAQQRLLEIVDNLPGNVAGFVLKRVIFPFGSSYKPPSDSLTRKVANLSLQTGDVRDRLTQGLYSPKGNKEALALLEQSMQQTLLAKPILKIIKSAIKNGTLSGSDPELCIDEAVENSVISDQDAQIVNDAISLRRAVIAVDDFPADFWTEAKSTWPQTSIRS